MKKSYPAFSHDNSYISKINEILKTLNMEQTMKNSRSKEVKEKTVVKPEMVTSLVKEKEDPKLKALDLKKTISESVPSRAPMISITPPTVSRPNYSRDVSIDRKIVKEHKFANVAAVKA
jgi:hypothetical protein